MRVMKSILPTLVTIVAANTSLAGGAGDHSHDEPTPNTMLMRLRTYYNYGKEMKKQAESEIDPVAKAELADEATGLFNRAIEIGVAMTNNFPATADGFFYLSLSQLEIGDYAASDANYKTYEELQSDVP